MSTPAPAAHRVLVVDVDARVRTALTALIDATPGLQVVAVCDSAERAAEARRLTKPAVAVVGMSCEGVHPDAVRILAPHLPVVAVSTRTSDARRALSAGAAVFCDQDGDADALSATILNAAKTAPSSSPGGIA